MKPTPARDYAREGEGVSKSSGVTVSDKRS